MQILQGQQPISARLVLRVGVTVVARHPDVIPDALELVVESVSFIRLKMETLTRNNHDNNSRTN